jgi:hypothetical protein
MTSFTDSLNTQDPQCCRRKSTRTSLEITLLENRLYALYVFVMLGTFSLFNNTKGIYFCLTLLVVILGNMYMINRAISENLHKGLDLDLDLDTSTESESDAESEADSDVNNAASILEEFKKVVNETDNSEELGEVATNSHAAAAEYDRVAREYTEIERIIQNVAAEYRQKAAVAREAAMAVNDSDADAEARANAADEREYNED